MPRPQPAINISQGVGRRSSNVLGPRNLDPSKPNSFKPARNRSTKRLISHYESFNKPTSNGLYTTPVSERPIVPAITHDFQKQPRLMNIGQLKGKHLRQSLQNLVTSLKKGGDIVKDKVVVPAARTGSRILTSAAHKTRQNLLSLEPTRSDKGKSVETHRGPLLHLSNPRSSGDSGLPYVLSVWTNCVGSLQKDFILLEWQTAHGNPGSRKLSLVGCTDVHSLALSQLSAEEKAMLPENGEEEFKVFEIIFEGRPRERFAAFTVQARAGWVSTIWNAVLSAQGVKQETFGDSTRYSGRDIDAVSSPKAESGLAGSVNAARKSSENSLPEAPHDEEKALPPSPKGEKCLNAESSLARNPSNQSTTRYSIVDSYLALDPLPSHEAVPAAKRPGFRLPSVESKLLNQSDPQKPQRPPLVKLSSKRGSYIGLGVESTSSSSGSEKSSTSNRSDVGFPCGVERVLCENDLLKNEDLEAPLGKTLGLERKEKAAFSGLYSRIDLLLSKLEGATDGINFKPADVEYSTTRSLFVSPPKVSLRPENFTSELASLDMKLDEILAAVSKFASLRDFQDKIQDVSSRIDQLGVQGRHPEVDELRAMTEKLCQRLDDAPHQLHSNTNEVGLGELRRLLLERMEQDRDVHNMQKSVLTLVAGVEGDHTGSSAVKTVAEHISRQKFEYQEFVASLVSQFREDMRAEKLQFVEEVKEATALNVQTHFDQLKEELVQEVSIMNRDIERMRGEKHLLESQISDLRYNNPASASGIPTTSLSPGNLPSFLPSPYSKFVHGDKP